MDQYAAAQTSSYILTQRLDPPPPTLVLPPKKTATSTKTKGKIHFTTPPTLKSYIYIYKYTPPPTHPPLTHGCVLPEERPADINAAWRDSAGAELEHGPHMETVNLDERLEKNQKKQNYFFFAVFRPRPPRAAASPILQTLI